MTTNTAILIVVLLSAAVLMWPRIAKSRLWRATITPLASIIGSGFLVLGPILDFSYGLYAPLVMAALCAGAYFFGAAIRHNIAVLDSHAPRGTLATRIEALASWTLAFAYIISVAYYLNLFGAFGVSLTPMNDNLHGKLLTSAAFFLILAVGWTHGFSALERMEQISVSIKLVIITGLLFGLGLYFVKRTGEGALVLNPQALSGWAAITVAFGLIVTVQGFETSRYLGAKYDAATRIRSMRLAQGVSAAIYMIYIALLAYDFTPGVLHHNETAIIGMTEIVAPILPALLVMAALAAQFSAAVADTSGSGGLIAELTHGRLNERQAYGILVAAGLTLTWSANIFEIISYASRAFAAYYALQAFLAAAAAWRITHQPARATAFLLLAVLGTAVTIFGTPVE